MLTNINFRRENADRAFARSADSLHSWPFNFSIGAKFGESAVAKQNVPDSTIDNLRLAIDCYAIEWPAIVNYWMREAEKIDAVETHRKSCPDSLEWFAGVRTAPRMHPWDEQELPYLTKAWIDVLAETAGEAQRIARRLFELGYGKSPIHTNSSSGKHIFAYAIDKKSSN